MSRSGNILLAVALLSSSTVEARQATAPEWSDDYVSITMNPHTQKVEDNSQSHKISDIDQEVAQYPRTSKERCKTAVMAAVKSAATAGKAAGDVLIAYQATPYAIAGCSELALLASSALGPLHTPTAAALQAFGWSMKHLTFVQSQVIPVAAVGLRPFVSNTTGFLYLGIGQSAVYIGKAGSNLMQSAWTKMLDAGFYSSTPKPPKPEEIEMKTFHKHSRLTTASGSPNNHGPSNPLGGPSLPRPAIPQSERTPVTDGNHPLSSPSSQSLTQDQLDLLEDAMQEERPASIAHLFRQPGETIQAWNQRTNAHWFIGSGPSSLTSSEHSTSPASRASISSTELNDLRDRLSHLRND